MSEGVTIGFILVALFFGGIGLLLFKEARTHRFWRQLVADNNLDAIRGILDQEIEHWKTQRPPKDISAVVWAGVQGMDLVTASAHYVRVSTSADPEFGAVDGVRQQVATSLDTAHSVALRLVEMIFYDVPNFRPAHVPRRCLHHLPRRIRRSPGPPHPLHPGRPRRRPQHRLEPTPPAPGRGVRNPRQPRPQTAEPAPNPTPRRRH